MNKEEHLNEPNGSMKDERKGTPAEQRPDAVTAQWPGEATLPPQVIVETDKENKREEEVTVIPLVR